MKKVFILKVETGLIYQLMIIANSAMQSQPRFRVEAVVLGMQIILLLIHRHSKPKSAVRTTRPEKSDIFSQRYQS